MSDTHWQGRYDGITGLPFKNPQQRAQLFRCSETVQLKKQVDELLMKYSGYYHDSVRGKAIRALQEWLVTMERDFAFHTKMINNEFTILPYHFGLETLLALLQQKE